MRADLRRPIVVGALLMLAGCSCQLSGTPLDTMEKRLNPACWTWGTDDPPAHETPPVPPPDERTR